MTYDGDHETRIRVSASTQENNKCLCCDTANCQIVPINKTSQLINVSHLHVNYIFVDACNSAGCYSQSYPGVQSIEINVGQDFKGMHVVFLR